MGLTDEIPGFREAANEEQFIRSAAFLPVTESICGIEVLPLTLAHFTMLEIARNPFVVGGNPVPEDIASFLWAVSPRYKPNAPFRRWWFVADLRDLDAEKVTAGIEAYMEDAFLDSPGGGKSDDALPTSSYAASLVDIIASEYCWSRSDILKMPFKEVFQYIKRMQKRANPKAPLFNKKSDKVKSEFLQARNA
ncbi:MAG: hypothetical protein JWM68_2524 [Verrucomicrobiales bacterium]|nr:hypothetical protein [Verrucomicrobiales bacterium]